VGSLVPVLSIKDNGKTNNMILSRETRDKRTEGLGKSRCLGGRVQYTKRSVICVNSPFDPNNLEKIGAQAEYRRWFIQS